MSGDSLNNTDNVRAT